MELPSPIELYMSPIKPLFYYNSSLSMNDFMAYFIEGTRYIDIKYETLQQGQTEQLNAYLHSFGYHVQFIDKNNSNEIQRYVVVQKLMTFEHKITSTLLNKKLLAKKKVYTNTQEVSLLPTYSEEELQKIENTIKESLPEQLRMYLLRVSRELFSNTDMKPHTVLHSVELPSIDDIAETTHIVFVGNGGEFMLLTGQNKGTIWKQINTEDNEIELVANSLYEYIDGEGCLESVYEPVGFVWNANKKVT